MSARGASCLFCVLAPCAAQVPAHAVLLNPSGRAYEPRFAVSGDTVHACGVTPSFPAGFIHYARSDDGGATWPVREQVIAYTTEFDDIAADGDLVVALVNSAYFGPHTITSRDGGHTWSVPVRVSQQSAYHQLTGARVLVHGTAVVVAWYEERAAGRAFLNRSADGGATWLPIDVRLDVGAAFGALNPYFNQMLLCADWPVLNVLWDHVAPSGFTALAQRSTDGGATWLPAAAPLAMGKLRGVSGAGATIVAVGEPAPTVLRSADAGATFQASTGHGLTMPQQVAVNGSIVVAAGNVATSGVGVQVNVSGDGGVTWPLPPQMFSFGTRVVVGEPHVAPGACLLRCQFFDPAGPSGLLFQSDDLGVTWRQLPGEAGVRVDAGVDRVLVATHTLSTSPSTWVYVAAGHTPLGAGTTGTGGAVPRLEGRGLPALGRSFRLEVTGARPLGLGAFATSFAPPAPVPLGAATLYAGQPIVPVVFATDAAGAGALQVAVPASPAFVGLVLTSQAFVLDAGAAGGFSSTRALRTWID
ncbi:MAG: sialidase family protein [Planctomycetota bacterium]